MIKATISLKQLRTDPREYIRLLQGGYEVSITEHRRTLVSSAAATNPKLAQRGDGRALLEHIKHMPPIETPFPNEDTTALVKRTKLQRLEKKYGYKE
jgi:hypothetical protein